MTISWMFALDVDEFSKKPSNTDSWNLIKIRFTFLCHVSFVLLIMKQFNVNKSNIKIKNYETDQI